MNHNTNRDLEMKFRTFTEIVSYAYTLDILIPHIVHMIYFDYTLPILQKLFSQSFEELTRCSPNKSCGQSEVSKCLVYRHILKWVFIQHCI